ncbi:uncharacterized protein LOC142356130, partial [Convolutriloba macropyga]|uniref:uncharacterized protein LOC142356130 n=1 Tax=Convolutriloba macropyga TaxID=536237 RepID=UPI003F52374D
MEKASIILICSNLCAAFSIISAALAQCDFLLIDEGRANNNAMITAKFGLWKFCTSFSNKTFVKEECRDYSDREGIDTALQADRSSFRHKNMAAAVMLIFSIISSGLYLLFEIGGCLDLQKCSTKVLYTALTATAFIFCSIGASIMTALYVDAWYDLKDDNEISIHKIANPIKVVISLIEHSFTESELVQLENIT